MIRFLATGLGALIVAAAVGIGFAGRTPFDATTYRQSLAEALSHLSGQEIRIDGEVSFTLLPTPSLTARDVHWDFGGRHQTAALIHLSPSLPALLRGRLQAATLTLVRPHIQMETAVLFQALVPAPDGTLSQTRFRLEEGTLTLISDSVTPGSEPVATTAATLPAAVFQAVTLEGQMPAPGSQAHLEGELVWQEQRWEMRVSAAPPSAAGAVPLNLTLHHPTADGQKKAAVEARFAGLISLDTSYRAIRGIQGELRLETADADAFFDALLPAPGPTALSSPRPLQFRTLVEATPERLTLQNSDLTIGTDTRATGQFSFQPPAIRDGDLTVNITRLGAAEQHRLAAWLERHAALFTALPSPHASSAGGEFHFRLDLESIRLAVSPLAGLAVTDLHLAGSLGSQGLTLRQAEFSTPGNGRFLAIGTVQPEPEPEPKDSQKLPPTTNSAGLAALWPHLRIDMTAEFTADNLRSVLEFLPLDLKGIPEDRLRRFASHLHYKGGRDHGHLSGFDLTLDGLSLVAAASFTRHGQPHYTLTLEGDNLDLDAYGFAPWLLRLGQQSFQALRAAPAAADLTARLSLKNLNLGQQSWPSLNLEGRMEKGRLDLAAFQARASTGPSLWLKGHINALDPAADTDLQVALDTPSLTSIRSWLPQLGGPAFPAGFPEPGALRLSGRVASRGDDAIHLEAGLSAEPGALTLKGQLHDWDSLPSFDGQIRIRHPQGSSLLQHLMPTWGMNTDGTLDLYAEISGSLDVLNVNAVQGQIAGITLRGDFLLDRTGNPPRLDAELTVGDLSLDRLLPGPHPLREIAVLLLRPVMPLAPVTLATSPEEGVPLFTFLRENRLEGRLQLNANRLLLNGLALEDLQLGLTVAEGTWRLDPLHARTEGGQVHLVAVVESNGDARYDVILANLPLVSTRLFPHLPQTFPLALSAYRFDARGQVIIPGSDLRVLSGAGSLSLDGGLITGINLNRLLATAAALNQPAAACIPALQQICAIAAAASIATTVPDPGLSCAPEPGAVCTAVRFDPAAVTHVLSAAAQGGETAFHRAGGRIFLENGHQIRLEDWQIAAMGGHLSLNGSTAYGETPSAAFTATVQPAAGSSSSSLPPLTLSLTASATEPSLVLHADSPLLHARLRDQRLAEEQAEAQRLQALHAAQEALAAQQREQEQAAAAAAAAAQAAEAEAAARAAAEAEAAARAAAASLPPPAPVLTPPAASELPPLVFPVPSSLLPAPAGPPSGTSSGTPSAAAPATAPPVSPPAATAPPGPARKTPVRRSPASPPSPPMGTSPDSGPDAIGDILRRLKAGSSGE